MKLWIGLFKRFALCAIVVVLLGCPGDLTPAFYYGGWVNDGPDTLFIARIVIDPEDSDTLIVRAYGACDPDDCDWGTDNAWFSGGFPSGMTWWQVTTTWG